MNRKYMHCIEMTWTDLVHNKVQRHGFSYHGDEPCHFITEQSSISSANTNVSCKYRYHSVGLILAGGNRIAWRKTCRTGILWATNLTRTGMASKPCLRDDRLADNVHIVFL
jgi:hypothetical protein